MDQRIILPTNHQHGCNRSQVALPGMIVSGSNAQAGYAVVFLTRAGTVQPFTGGNPSGELLDRLVDSQRDSRQGPAAEDGLVSSFAAAARQLHQAQGDGMLLRVYFTSLFEYLLVRVAFVTTVNRCHGVLLPALSTPGTLLSSLQSN